MVMRVFIDPQEPGYVVTGESDKPIRGQDVQLATATERGAMAAAQFTKLSGIETGAEVNNYKGDWSSTPAYAVGDSVRDGTAGFFICRVAVTAGTNTRPSTDTTNWGRLDGGTGSNVQADWNASSGDAQILNKPSNSDLGDIAFSNPPSDLTDAEQLAARNAIDATSPDDFTTPDDAFVMAYGDGSTAAAWPPRAGVFMVTTDTSGAPATTGTGNNQTLTNSVSAPGAVTAGTRTFILSASGDDFLHGNPSIAVTSTLVNKLNRVALFRPGQGGVIESMRWNITAGTITNFTEVTASTGNYVYFQAAITLTGTIPAGGQLMAFIDRALGHVDVTLDQSQILGINTPALVGDEAFSNPPSDLTATEQTAARDAIDATGPGDFRTLDNEFLSAWGNASSVYIPASATAAANGGAQGGFNVLATTFTQTPTPTNGPSSDAGLNDITTDTTGETRWFVLNTEQFDQHGNTPPGTGRLVVESWINNLAEIAVWNENTGLDRSRRIVLGTKSNVASATVTGKPRNTWWRFQAVVYRVGSLTGGLNEFAFLDARGGRVEVEVNQGDVIGLSTAAQVGDQAFSNPPSDLTTAEQTAARTAIGAGDATRADLGIGTTTFYAYWADAYVGDSLFDDKRQYISFHSAATPSDNNLYVRTSDHIATGSSQAVFPTAANSSASMAYGTRLATDPLLNNYSYISPVPPSTTLYGYNMEAVDPLAGYLTVTTSATAATLTGSGNAGLYTQGITIQVTGDVANLRNMVQLRFVSFVLTSQNLHIAGEHIVGAVAAIAPGAGTYKGLWRRGGYSVGDIVRNGSTGNFYICTAERRWANSGNPATDTTAWDQIDSVASGSLTDAQIGDKAFSNPPSDLTDAEKLAARNSIGAGTGGSVTLATNSGLEQTGGALGIDFADESEVLGREPYKAIPANANRNAFKQAFDIERPVRDELQLGDYFTAARGTAYTWNKQTSGTSPTTGNALVTGGQLRVSDTDSGGTDRGTSVLGTIDANDQLLIINNDTHAAVARIRATADADDSVTGQHAISFVALQGTLTQATLPTSIRLHILTFNTSTSSGDGVAYATGTGLTGLTLRFDKDSKENQDNTAAFTAVRNKVFHVRDLLFTSAMDLGYEVTAAPTAPTGSATVWQFTVTRLDGGTNGVLPLEFELTTYSVLAPGETGIGNVTAQNLRAGTTAARLAFANALGVPTLEYAITLEPKQAVWDFRRNITVESGLGPAKLDNSNNGNWRRSDTTTTQLMWNSGHGGYLPVCNWLSGTLYNAAVAALVPNLKAEDVRIDVRISARSNSNGIGFFYFGADTLPPANNVGQENEVHRGIVLFIQTDQNTSSVLDANAETDLFLIIKIPATNTNVGNSGDFGWRRPDGSAWPTSATNNDVWYDSGENRLTVKQGTWGWTGSITTYMDIGVNQFEGGFWLLMENRIVARYTWNVAAANALPSNTHWPFARYTSSAPAATAWSNSSDYTWNAIVSHNSVNWVADDDPAPGQEPGVSEKWRELKAGEYVWTPGGYYGFAGQSWQSNATTASLNRAQDVRIQWLFITRNGLGSVDQFFAPEELNATNILAQVTGTRNDNAKFLGSTDGSTLTWQNVTRANILARVTGTWSTSNDKVGSTNGTTDLSWVD